MTLCMEITPWKLKLHEYILSFKCIAVVVSIVGKNWYLIIMLKYMCRQCKVDTSLPVQLNTNRSFFLLWCSNTCARMRTHNTTNMRACTHTYTRVYTHKHMHMHTHTYIHTRVRIHSRTHTHTQTQTPPTTTHTHIHTYIHTCMCEYTRTQTCVCVWWWWGGEGCLCLHTHTHNTYMHTPHKHLYN